MSTLYITGLAVLVSDQAIKLLLRRLIGDDSLALGRLGSVRIVAGRLWLRRLAGPCSGATIWYFWVAAAIPLILVGPLVTSWPVFAGLLLGGSLSHAVDSSMRGSITAYICLRFWPAFNLADLAITAGAIGIMAELVLVVYARMS